MISATQPYHLFLDDERTPKQVTWVELPLVSWTIVRNYDQFVQCIMSNDLPNTISFDHDLAFEHYPFAENRPGLKIPYDTYKEKTGWHCAVWLAEYCGKVGRKVPKCFIHTMNITGKENIRIVIQKARMSWLDDQIAKLKEERDGY